MKNPIKLGFTAIMLFLFTLYANAQFEPQTGMFKGAFEGKEFTGDLISTMFANRELQKKPSHLDDVEWGKDNNKCRFIMDYYKVTFGFWTLLGEPVCETKFYWEYDKRKSFSHTYKGKQYDFTISNLEKYPDLIKKFKYITPLPDLKLDVVLAFYTEGIDYPIATCMHKMWIDLASPAFVKENFSLPGSIDWDEMFTEVIIKDTPYKGGKQMERKYWGEMPNENSGYVRVTDKKIFAKNMLLLFANTSRIEVTNFYGTKGVMLPPSFISLKWNFSEVSDIFNEYCRREAKADQAKTQTKTPDKKSDDDFWNSSSTTATTTETDDFWNSSAPTPVLWADDLDKAESLYADKKWEEARDIYQAVSNAAPSLEYAKNKMAYIDKLLAYKPKSETFTDPRDGKVYKIVTIGTQTWMAENLAYNAGEGCCAFDNDQRNVAIYGYLYNEEAAKKACPSGWHIPTVEEWRILISFVGSDAATKLKSTIGWKNNGNGNNIYGFNLLPGGCGDSFGKYFNAIGETCYLISECRKSKKDYCHTVIEVSSYISESDIYIDCFPPSVRCIKNY